MGLLGFALQRLLAGAPRVAGHRPDEPRWLTSRSSAAPSARNYSSRPASTPRTASRWPPRPRSARSAMSPAAAVGQPGPCHPARPDAPSSTAAPGRRAGVRPDRTARTHRPGRDGDDVQHGRRHGRGSEPEDTDRALAILTARHLDCWVLGTVNKARKGETRAIFVGATRGFEAELNRLAAPVVLVGPPVVVVVVVGFRRRTTRAGAAGNRSVGSCI